ncbi:flagellar protein FlgN [Bacillus sp. APMAM]|nr:flagellar protein FlgN [Bacillus sp. APMAM]RTZ55030.1 flagellar protein FlgN [Bacillus sp. SAJ1]
MSTPLLVEVLNKMLQIHQSLYDITYTKTEVIKNGDIEDLQNIIRDEQKHVAALQLLEKQRLEAIGFIQKELAIKIDNPTVSELLYYISGIEKEEIKRLQENLVAKINGIVERNDLNQQLLVQSLEFVNLNLDLLMPSPEFTNYTMPSKEENTPVSRSFFDSQA